MKREKRKRDDLERFVACYPAAAQELFSRLERGLPAEVGLAQYDPQAKHPKLLAELCGTPLALGVCVCRSLGGLDKTWGGVYAKECVALAAAMGLSSDTFMQVIETLKDDPLGLLGAARLFHGYLKLPQEKSLEWELRLVEITLAKGYPDNFRTVVESLASRTEPAAWDFLRKLAAGEVSVREWSAADDVGRDSDLNRKEPHPRAHAILLLARHGDAAAKPLAAKLEATKPSELDQAALEVAQGLMGEAGSVKRRHFSTHSSIIIKMAFEALEKQGDRDALDLVVDQASTHSNWRLIPDEAVRSAQRMTGVKFYPDVGPPPSQYADDVRKWWEKNRETFKKPQ